MYQHMSLAQERRIHIRVICSSPEDCAARTLAIPSIHRHRILVGHTVKSKPSVSSACRIKEGC